MYQLLFRLVLQRIDPERAHALAERSLSFVRATGLGRWLVRRLVGATDRRLQTHALGLTFTSPVGVSAGVDKDASWFDDLGALGFGFVEVGTITAVPQGGNPRPRIARLPRDRALLNKMGFPNPGAAAAAARLRGRTCDTVVGVNIGKSRMVSLDAAGADCRNAVRHLAPVADYLVINVSSPNTPGVRDLQAVDRLRELIDDVRRELSAISCALPLLIKIGPDLDDGELDAVAALALELQLDGIVAVNTTVNRASLTDLGRQAVPFDGGGVSGAPLAARSLAVLRHLRLTCADRLVLISVGGVRSAEDVIERIAAGATLVQVYTALVYGGPAWPRRINRDLVRMLREAGVASVQDLVGNQAAGAPATLP